MIEKVFSIGDFAISPFGVMLVAAFFVAYWQLRRGLERLDIGGEEDASAMVFAAALGGIVGGKVYYAALYRDWSLLYDRAGLVWYGSLIGGFLAVAWVIRRRRLPLWSTLDASTLGLTLGYAVGRVGCFLVGDDYGRPTDLPWGVEFRVGVPPTTAANLRDFFGVEPAPGVDPSAFVAVHPTQLYETLAAIAIWLLALRLLRVPLRPGVRFGIVIALLACERFAVEILRAKDDRFFGPFTVAQAISAALLLLALGIVWSRSRAAAPPVAAVAVGRAG